jgi:hypothetical protein
MTCNVSRGCLRHEEFDNFRIGDVNVTVTVDFVGRMPDGTLVLADGKTGWDDDEYETELRMAAVIKKEKWYGESCE